MASDAVKIAERKPQVLSKIASDGAWLGYLAPLELIKRVPPISVILLCYAPLRNRIPRF